MFFFSCRRDKNLTSHSAAAKARRFVRSLPLCLEVLEDRTLLSQDLWQAGSGNWNVGSNWSLGHAPGTDDTAIIKTSTAATITIQPTDNIQVQSVTTGSNDTLSMAGGSLTVTSGASTLSGTLSMTGGYLSADGSSVILTVNGSTTIADASLYDENGATLSLPQLISYTADSTTFTAGI